MFDLLLSVCQCVQRGCNYWLLCNKVAENFTCNGSYITCNNGWSIYCYGVGRRQRKKQTRKKKSKCSPGIPSKMAEIISNATCTGEFPFRVLNTK